jgi:hypothetical protein
MTVGEDSKRRSHLPTANALAFSPLTSLFHGTSEARCTSHFR